MRPVPAAANCCNFWRAFATPATREESKVSGFFLKDSDEKRADITIPAQDIRKLTQPAPGSVVLAQLAPSLLDDECEAGMNAAISRMLSDQS